MSDKNYGREAGRLLDETLDVGRATLETLRQQGERLHALHDKVNIIAGRVQIGDTNLARILRLESFGTFLGIGCVLLVLAVWIFIKLVI